MRTPIEARMASLLQSQSISFREQVRVGRFTADFVILLSSGRPAFFLECDGAEYHDVEKDRQRDSEIAELTGLTVLRVAGRDINFATSKVISIVGARLQAEETSDGQQASALSEAQRAVITAPLGPLLVYAPAGSGKTRTLIERIIFVIHEYRLDVSRLCALTFTRAAALEIKSRLADTLSPTAAEACTIGTFHSLAGLFGVAKGLTVDATQRIVALTQAIRTTGLRMLPVEFGNEVSRRKADLIDVEAYERSLHKTDGDAVQSETDDTKFLRAWKHYEELMRSRKQCDYDDLILWMARKSETDSVWANQLASRFDYVLVDEAQDNNAAQNAMLNALTIRHRNFMVVGDDDQSIYGFRGARPEIFRDREKEPGVIPYSLDANYRSHPHIVRAALCFITGARERRLKQMSPRRKAVEGGARLEPCSGVVDEARIITRHIKEACTLGREFGDFAILVRSNFQTSVIAYELASAGIGYINYSDESFVKKLAAQVGAAYVRFACKTASWPDWQRVLSHPNRYFPKALWDQLKVSPNPLETWARLAASLHGTKEQWKGERWNADIAQLRAFMSDAPRFSPRELVREARQRFELDSLFDVVVDGKVLYSGVPHLEYLESMARAFGEAAEFLGYLDALENPRTCPSVSRVSIMTIHKSKGLEFPVVFVTGLANRLFPHHLGDDQEERRLCYVAMTRARDDLILLPDAENPSGLVAELKRSVMPGFRLKIAPGTPINGTPYQVGARARDRTLGLVTIRAYSNRHGFAVEDKAGGTHWLDEAAARERLRPLNGKRYNVRDQVKHSQLGRGIVTEYDDERGYRVEFVSQTLWFSEEFAIRALSPETSKPWLSDEA